MLEKKRLEYKPEIPELLNRPEEVQFVKDSEEVSFGQKMSSFFPRISRFSLCSLVKKEGISHPVSLRIGAFFSGGPAPGQHNVLWGLFDITKKALIGFLNGPDGAINNQFKELSSTDIYSFRNQGGCDLIGTGRTKIETEKQMACVLKTCEEHQLDGLVVIGGDDSNTNAAYLAEYFLSQKSTISVVGVPKTIDGDLRSKEIEISFGFDTASKTYSEIIGNICRDAISSKKYTHFIKLMGRSSSHLVFECALATQPNCTLIAEEERSFHQIVQEIAELIERRKALGKEYGVILIPEGLIESMPEMKALISELNKKGKPELLSTEQVAFFSQLPENIQKQLLLDRDPHGNFSVSQIETEQLFIDMLKQKLGTFSTQKHFLGYEGRSAYPTNFDATYAYALGRTAALAVRDKLTAVICAISCLRKKPAEWQAKAVPILSMMVLENRKGVERPVVQKALVDIKGKSFVSFSQLKKSWELEDLYCYPGPIQFFGENDRKPTAPITLG